MVSYSLGLTRERLSRYLETIPPEAEHMRPVMQLVRDGGIAFQFIGDTTDPFRIPSKRPALVILGDDMECSKGPARFHARSLRRAIEACHAIAIVSGAPVLQVYAAAALAAALNRRHAMIIETRVSHEAEWLQFVQKFAPGRLAWLATPKRHDA